MARSEARGTVVGEVRICGSVGVRAGSERAVGAPVCPYLYLYVMEANLCLMNS